MAEAELVSKISALMQSRYGGTDAVARRRLFQDYDRNADGHICRSELARLLEDAGVGNSLTRGFWVKGVIARLDVDDTQTISYEELEAVMASVD